MKKLFGLALLALAFLTPDLANAASRFWVGGTGTWDASDTTHWAATSGGAGGQSVPGAGDTVTFDGSSGGGTVTVNTTVNVLSITAGAFTGTLDFSVNNNNVTTSAGVTFSGTGTRTINMGSGTWTFTSGGNQWTNTNVTNLTATFQNAALVFTANSNNRVFAGGGLTYGSLTINNNSQPGTFEISGSNTFASVTAGSGVTLFAGNFNNQTVTGALNITGTAAAPCSLMGTTNSTTQTNWAVGAASTAVWTAFFNVNETGAGSITATNSFDLGKNSNLIITPPSVGGGGGGRIIGG